MNADSGADWQTGTDLLDNADDTELDFTCDRCGRDNLVIPADDTCGNIDRKPVSEYAPDSILPAQVKHETPRPRGYGKSLSPGHGDRYIESVCIVDMTVPEGDFWTGFRPRGYSAELVESTEYDTVWHADA